MEIYIACIFTDLCEQNILISILSITVALCLVSCQIHVIELYVDAAYLISSSQRYNIYLFIFIVVF